MLDGALTDFERIDVAGVMTERLRSGQGRPLLYLHDGTGLEYSRTFLEGLGRHFQVHALSHPGFGGSDLPANFTSVDDLAYHYLNYIEAENLNDVVVVGVSFGGWIAAELATKASSRLGALVLIDAYGIKIGPRDKLDVADIFYLLPEEVRDMGWHAKRSGQKAQTIEGARRIARNRESLSLFAWSPLLHNPKLLGRLHRIKIPTQVLWGASDRLAPVDYGRAYAAAIKNATFTLIPEAGHLPHMEQTDAVLSHINKFLGA